jgi:tetratricopeptide (TPR) repeat protein
MRLWPEHKEDALTVKRLKDLTILYIQQGNYQQADAIITNLLTNHSGSSHIGNYAWKVAIAYNIRKEYEKAKELCQLVLRDLPDYSHRVDTVSLLIDCLLRLEEYDQAATIATDLLENTAIYENSDRYRLLAHETLGRIYVKTGDAAKAAEERETASMELDWILSSYVQEPDFDAILELGEAYYSRAEEAISVGNREEAKANFEKSIAIIEQDVLGIVESDPNGVINTDSDIADYPTMSKNVESDAWYQLALSYWQLGQWFSAADAFLYSIDANPNHEFAGSMHWLVSDCYEKLKRDEAVLAEEADPLIEWGYQTLFDQYPESRDVEYAAIRLIEINLARGRPVTALVYVNWFLDHSAFDDPRRMHLIHHLMAGMEVCGQ